MNLIAGFLDTATRIGPRPAIITGRGDTITFDALARRSGGLAASLRRQGVQRGDRVLVALPIGIELYLAIAALWRLGATIIFPEPAMGLAGVRHAVGIARPSALLVGGIYRLLPLLVPSLLGVRHLHMGMAHGDVLEDIEPDHPALISFTSGSTGQPKGIVRSHGFLGAQNAALHDLIAPKRDDETDLVAFPVFVIANLSLGTTSVLPNWRLSRHDAADADAAIRHMAEHRVTRALVPPSIAELLADAGQPAPLDLLFTGGGPVFPDLLKRLTHRLPHTDVTTVYGSTEAEPIAHQRVREIDAAQWQAMEEGAGLLAGRPVSAVALDIVDDEIIVTGEHVNKSYMDGAGDAENKVNRAGAVWHRTGDAGRLDAQGKLWLRGRIAASSAGRYPFEIEAVVRHWPGVRRAALVPGREPLLLAIEGDESKKGRWDELADKLGAEVIRIPLPLDRRHRSKIDYTRLKTMVASKR
jgi:acyl-CoA synthetase (AMP-forming)/AMP-acid ligase II